MSLHLRAHYSVYKYRNDLYIPYFIKTISSQNYSIHTTNIE